MFNKNLYKKNKISKLQLTLNLKEVPKTSIN